MVVKEDLCLRFYVLQFVFFVTIIDRKQHHVISVCLATYLIWYIAESFGISDVIGKNLVVDL
jgi:uncharacterized membrane protein (DUF106 family)